ncbi:hypothetical protein [Halalkalibaculum sp. DA384]|uniref:hypothetical protein n=1 Tax=Halalkalibaculum sp. DA384 TaxID=3373606 RepID=UPI003755214B
MSYALRNTLILSLVFLLITGGGWAYIEFLQKPELERLQGEVTEKRTELSNKQETANQYDMLAEQYENAQYYIKNYDKGLYFSSNEDKVFDFINQLNSGPAVTDFSFTFVDSTSQGQFGIINMQISGSGFYRNVVNFIRRIELSKPINKIANLNISPINNLESYGRVNFNFALASYYSRSSIVDATELTISNSILESVYNPFYPFIREIEPNEENLIDIESSSLVALSSNAVFVIDQNGSMQKLQVGDRVYLGRLETVNIQQQSAIFELNKGGIIEHVTLEVQQ